MRLPPGRRERTLAGTDRKNHRARSTSYGQPLHGRISHSDDRSPRRADPLARQLEVGFTFEHEVELLLATRALVMLADKGLVPLVATKTFAPNVVRPKKC